MSHNLLKLFLAAGLTVQLVAQQRELKPGFNFFSKQQDVQLGREAAQQVERQVRVVRNGELNDYITRVGRRLAAQPQADEYPYTFKMVQDNSINAFALPGGPTYIHTGLIAAADNEAQLAGVMAHEIAHVALRHGTNQASKANLIQLPAMLAGALAGNGSMMGQLAQLGIGLGANSVLLKFSRNAERDADLLGARIMAGAGYNPIEMARFFEKLEAKGGSRAPQFLSDHPNPGNRVRAVEEEIRYMPQRSYSAGTGNFDQMRSLVARGVSSDQGNRRAGNDGGSERMPNIQTSSRFREYRSNDFSISYPENWRVMNSQNDGSLTIAPEEGVSNNGLGYGVVIGMFSSQGGRGNLNRDTQDLIRQLQSTNPSMRTGQGSRSSNVGGRRALLTTLSSQSPYAGQTEQDALVTVEHPEGIFYILFVAPQSDFRQLERVFENMLRSVRFTS